MTNEDRIRRALAPLGIPVTTPPASGRAETYAVVYELLSQPEQFADGRETLSGYYAQIDFISKRNIAALVRRAERLLASAGFVRRERRSEYEPQSNTNRHMLRVRRIHEYEEEEE